jgi:hypothetical protein
MLRVAPSPFAIALPAFFVVETGSTISGYGLWDTDARMTNRDLDPVTVEPCAHGERGVLGPTTGGAYAFTYLPCTPLEDLVSLTMPVRLESYVWRRGLPPFFLMNLPEGFQKDLVRAKLGPHAEVTDPGLLALTGNRTIGRVRVLPQGQPLAHASDDLSLSTLLATSGSREHPWTHPRRQEGLALGQVPPPIRCGAALAHLGANDSLHRGGAIGDHGHGTAGARTRRCASRVSQNRKAHAHRVGTRRARHLAGRHCEVARCRDAQAVRRSLRNRQTEQGQKGRLPRP